MNPAFWRKKRVFLTGHTGFKGSWLSLWLQDLGAELTGYALPPPTQPSLFEEGQVAKGMRSIIGDVRDYEKLSAAICSARPEVVIHMAAQPLVRYSYAHPVETYATNVMGTVHLLEAVRSYGGAQAIVNVTTDKCYSNREWVWGYREDESLGGHDPYSSSKGCSELVSSAYRTSYFSLASDPRNATALATARAGNVIGGGDWAKDRLIPDLIEAFSLGKPLEIRNPHAIRPWQHVLEPLRGYLDLAERLTADGETFAEAWNFGPLEDDARPVAFIVQKLSEIWPSDAHWHVDERAHPHEAHHLKLDISKARTRLGWTPKLPLEQALDWIVQWTQERSEGINTRSITLDQIRTYQALTLS
jgi:CDP-glucose 4,6-dehydratase